MWTLFSLLGMIAYLGMLVLLGINHWALDFRASTGHPTTNDFILFALGLGSSGLAGAFASIIATQGIKIEDLESKNKDLNRAALYFDIETARQKSVEERLANVARLWKEKRELYFSIIGDRNQDLDTISERLREQERWIKHYNDQFLELYDFAARVFEMKAALKQRNIKAYLPPDDSEALVA